MLIILLMNTFLYCGAGELVIEQVSYTYSMLGYTYMTIVQKVMRHICTSFSANNKDRKVKLYITNFKCCAFYVKLHGILTDEVVVITFLMVSVNNSCVTNNEL